MTCPKPGSATAEYQAQVDRIRALWTYDVPPPAGFHAELQHQEGGPPAWVTVGTAYTPARLRQFRFSLVEPISGNQYRVRVSTTCLSCEQSEWKNSSVILIP